MFCKLIIAGKELSTLDIKLSQYVKSIEHDRLYNITNNGVIYPNNKMRYDNYAILLSEIGYTTSNGIILAEDRIKVMSDISQMFVILEPGNFLIHEYPTGECVVYRHMGSGKFGGLHIDNYNTMHIALCNVHGFDID